MDEIVNRVANSPLVSIDLDQYMDTAERIKLDIKQFLFEGMLLREKEFRASVREHDWGLYQNKNVMVFCSEDTIIPSWAYMIVMSKLSGANIAVFGLEEDLEKRLIDRAIGSILRQDLQDKKVVIKGCGDLKSRDYAYFELTKALVPVVSSLMYGEPCSTVPVFKRAF